MNFVEKLDLSHLKFSSETVSTQSSESYNNLPIDLSSMDLFTQNMYTTSTSSNSSPIDSIPIDYTEINEMRSHYNINIDQTFLGHNESLYVPKTYTKCKHDRNIIGDLKDIPVAEYIKKTANDVFLQLVTGIRRKTPRNKMLYFCLSIAYKIHGVPYLPGELASYVQLKMTDIPNANAMFSKSITGFQVKTVDFTPLDYIPLLYKTLRIASDHKDMIINMGNSILEKDDDLLNEFPQDVAAGIILCFMDITGIEFEKPPSYRKKSGISINEQVFADILYKSPNTLKTMKNRIISIYNS